MKKIAIVLIILSSFIFSQDDPPVVNEVAVELSRLIAKDLLVESGSEIHYDASIIGEGMTTDVQYEVHEIYQGYR